MAAADPIFEALGLKQVDEPSGYQFNTMPLTSGSDAAQVAGMPSTPVQPDGQACAGSAFFDCYATHPADASASYYGTGAWPPQNTAWCGYMQQAAAVCAAAVQALSSASTNAAMHQASSQQPGPLVLPDLLLSDLSRSVPSFNGAAVQSTSGASAQFPWGSIAYTDHCMWTGAAPAAKGGNGGSVTPSTWAAASPHGTSSSSGLSRDSAASMQTEAGAGIGGGGVSEGSPARPAGSSTRERGESPGTPSSTSGVRSGDSEKENAPIELNLAERMAPPSPAFFLEQQQQREKRKGTPLSLLNSLSPPFSDAPPVGVPMLELTPPPKPRSFPDLSDSLMIASPAWDQEQFLDACGASPMQAASPPSASVAGADIPSMFTEFAEARARLLAFRSAATSTASTSDDSAQASGFCQGSLKAMRVPALPNMSTDDSLDGSSSCSVAGLMAAAATSGASAVEPASPGEKDSLPPKSKTDPGVMLLQLLKGRGDEATGIASKRATTPKRALPTPAAVLAGKGASRGEIRARAAAARAEATKTSNALAVLLPGLGTPEKPAPPSRRGRRQGKSDVTKSLWSSDCHPGGAQTMPDYGLQEECRQVPRLRIGRSGLRSLKP